MRGGGSSEGLGYQKGLLIEVSSDEVLSHYSSPLRHGSSPDDGIHHTHRHVPLSMTVDSATGNKEHWWQGA